ncbi:nodulation protein NodU [Bradyrhizobium yuanmingense]|uniref:nodulation protein NodU n=1 Tax=Bradyrhizobium yuanmingense TaxID=108015 RepID=UPI0023B965B0|nr:nodulation protein NodU [Bradyrhizobium yuanmingense]MDF0581967.1 carbamoyltransferase N-terminal domain-containing protein [Bradyrhizobium yuanmingense]
MRICGIKLTHDGAIALVDKGRLVFSIEQEKRDNNARYQSIDNLDAIVVALAEHGLDVRDVDQFVIDGWGGEIESRFDVFSGSNPITLKAGPYLERHAEGLLTSRDGIDLVLNDRVFTYESYPHVTGHVASAYCTSPFAEVGQPAFCLVWDGGMFPRLYYVERCGARFLECLFPMIGFAYVVMGRHFGPYRRKNRGDWSDRALAGKLMAYIALGSVDEEIITIFRKLYDQRFAAEFIRRYSADITGMESAVATLNAFFEVSAPELKDKAPENVLSSFHYFLERMLVRAMTIASTRYSYLPGRRNLCIAGGCGLNIKWNSALRAMGVFDNVWVPPFPNDSGSAIGAACAAIAARKGFLPLEWSVYSGPVLKAGAVPSEWKFSPCNTAELAAILANKNPVIFLVGRAELGPRALGGRSILADATSARMKDSLNDFKLREYFRPVAPICLEDRAPEIFSPGTADPYMLFDHQTRPEWHAKIPAVIHLDGSARLQTIRRTAQHQIAELLVEYEKLTGIPLLCNTSANDAGRGFFPDVASACKWGRVGHVWSEGVLWTKKSCP